MATIVCPPEQANADLATDEMESFRAAVATMKNIRAAADAMAEDMLDQYRASDWEEAKDVVEGLNTARMVRVALEVMARRAARQPE